MIILAFDCTAAACSVAVWRDGTTLAGARELMERGQAEALAPMIDACMKSAGVAFADVARIGVTVGPGSFTGVRVGLAAARGFGFAKIIGTGNEADLTAGEVAEFLVDDPETDAILLFLETIRRPDAFERAARRAQTLIRSVRCA